MRNFYVVFIDIEMSTAPPPIIKCELVDINSIKVRSRLKLTFADGKFTTFDVDNIDTDQNGTTIEGTSVEFNHSLMFLSNGKFIYQYSGSSDITAGRMVKKVDRIEILYSPATCGGANIKYKGKLYKIHIGSLGGKYIIVNKKKIYI
jgi:hypothetical protein